MKPYLFGERLGCDIINLEKTAVLLKEVFRSMFIDIIGYYYLFFHNKYHVFIFYIFTNDFYVNLTYFKYILISPKRHSPTSPLSPKQLSTFTGAKLHGPRSQFRRRDPLRLSPRADLARSRESSLDGRPVLPLPTMGRRHLHQLFGAVRRRHPSTRPRDIRQHRGAP